MKIFKNSSVWLIALSLGAMSIFIPRHMVAQKSPDIRSFVTRIYPHGIPYLEAKSYGHEAVPELVKMLNDSEMEYYHANIILTLGMIGDTVSINHLKEFLASQEDEISPSSFTAVLALFQALGYLAQNGSDEAVKILSNWTRQDYWKYAKLNFSYKHYNDGILGEVFGRLAIQGLGMSGRSEARQILESLRKDKNLRSDWADNVTEALNLNLRVNEEGAEKVFGQEVGK
jgi:hypothetical protein